MKNINSQNDLNSETIRVLDVLPSRRDGNV